MPVMTLLTELNAKIAECRQCPLCEERTNTVPGEGRADAEIMFIGEGPGAEEDQQGRPFVGRSGQLLTYMLNQIGIERQQVFIGNTVKCRPPGNRTPLPAEMEACRPYLQAQMALIRPRLIVTLGAPALLSMCGEKYKLGETVGREYILNGQLFFATWHPSYVLRTQKLKPDYLRHFMRIKQVADAGFRLGQ